LTKFGADFGVDFDLGAAVTLSQVGGVNLRVLTNSVSLKVLTNSVKLRVD
jgi:hypothetical protein